MKNNNFIILDTIILNADPNALDYGFSIVSGDWNPFYTKEEASNSLICLEAKASVWHRHIYEQYDKKKITTPPPHTPVIVDNSNPNMSIIKKWDGHKYTPTEIYHIVDLTEQSNIINTILKGDTPYEEQ